MRCRRRTIATTGKPYSFSTCYTVTGEDGRGAICKHAIPSIMPHWMRIRIKHNEHSKYIIAKKSFNCNRPWTAKIDSSSADDVKTYLNCRFCGRLRDLFLSVQRHNHSHNFSSCCMQNIHRLPYGCSSGDYIVHYQHPPPCQRCTDQLSTLPGPTV